MRLHHLAVTVILATLGLGLGCSSGPVPTDRLTSTGAAIRAANEVGAKGVPQAALHLKLAVDQLEHAKKLIDDKENDRAAMVLLRAEADAELAVALAREAQFSAEAQRAQEKLRSLRTGE